MKKILIFGAFLAIFGVASVDAAVRDGTTPGRTPKTQQRISTNEKSDARRPTVLSRTSTTDATRTQPAVQTRTAKTKKQISTRSATNTPRSTATQKTDRIARAGTTNTRSPRKAQQTSARVADTDGALSLAQTRTGNVYEQCKSAYFQCMDQFCQLKNDDYRRCSCSDRVIDLAEVRQNLDETNTKLTEFTDNLSVVGLTAAQATAMNTASDGENALTADASASKALLQAIMNSIRGEDASVGGKMSNLDSINISFDTTNAFGMTDSAQLVASYNGTALYNAVFPNCRTAVKNDCNDASLQRAVTAYLMAIEQDCNTVQTALSNKQKDLKSAIREGSAMLDLARIENRKKHNSDDLTSCINNIETAILSEEVCGANYHKCLDNGQFIDVTTGAPIVGVTNFYELENLLKFADGVDAASQKLSMVPSNRGFVTNFENKTKKFAMNALDKCTEIADKAWKDYLDKALLDIYYAQNAKVDEIKQGCFDFISNCYSEREASITAAMQSLIEGADISLTPNKIVLTKTMCNDYIDSCNAMFDDNIIAAYIEKQQDTDTTAACRAVVQQCFTKYGGAQYENFYNPYSGLFQKGIPDEPVGANDDNTGIMSALDWFSLYEYDSSGKRVESKYKSPCAQEVAKIASCADKIEVVFGGFDSIISCQEYESTYKSYLYSGEHENCVGDNMLHYAYGWVRPEILNVDNNSNIHSIIPKNGSNDTYWDSFNRNLRPSGVASQVYYEIINKLQTNCANAQGKFIEPQFINHDQYGFNTRNGADSTNVCILTKNPINDNDITFSFIMNNNNTYEDVCPKDYSHEVDTNAWGACLCWENGGRRSYNGQSLKCDTAIFSQECCQPNTTNDSCSSLCQASQIDNQWGTCNNIDMSHNRVCPQCSVPCEGVTEAQIPYGN